MLQLGMFAPHNKDVSYAQVFATFAKENPPPPKTNNGNRNSFTKETKQP